MPGQPIESTCCTFQIFHFFIHKHFFLPSPCILYLLTTNLLVFRPIPLINALPFKHSFLPNFTHLYHISLSVVVYRSPFPVISIPLSRVQEESMPGCPRRGKRPAIGCFGQLSSFSCVLVWLSLILRHFSNRNFISSKESADCCCLFCSFCLKGSLIIRRW